MARPRCTFLVVDEDGTGRIHRARLRTGTLDALLRRAISGRLERLPVAVPGLAVWCDEDGSPMGRSPNPAGSRLVAHLGGHPIALAGPIAVAGRRGGTITGLSAEQVTALLSALTPTTTARPAAGLRPAIRRASITPTLED